tara:strand:+ start:31 stop:303 length:273 start_codon:yes stop_codon:yes gene_type:complete
MNKELYCLILEKILEEEDLSEISSVGGGSITGFSLPLGASSGEKVKYRKPSEKIDSPIKKNKNNKKKKYNRSVQYYLKHGGEKTRKRKFK